MSEGRTRIMGRKILFYSSYPGFSGSQRTALQLAEAFARLGAKVVAAAPGPMEYLSRAREVGLAVAELRAGQPLLEYGGVTTRRIACMGQAIVSTLLYTAQTYRYLRKNQIDLVYAATGRCTLLIAPGARLAGIPVLWHAQGGLVKAPNWLYRTMGLLATKIVCVSRSVQEDLIGVCGSRIAAKTSVVYNGIPDIVMEEHNKPDSIPRIVGYVGNLVPQKGIHHLIRAFGCLPKGITAQTYLWLVGPEPDPSYATHLRTLIAELRISDRVRFIGYVVDVASYIQQMTLVVAPSVEKETLIIGNGEVRIVESKEGFGLSALEAMRAGKPVIASNSFGLAEVVSDGESGILVPPGDEGALRNAMLTLLAQPEAARRMGELARRRFLSCFTSERMISGFRSVVEQLLPQGNVG